jgi:hypothetical protein
MGAWGAGSFENDGALDLIAELADGADLTPVTSALAAVNDLGPADYLEAPESEAAVAAAEVVAAIRGARGPALPDEVDEWLESHPSIGLTADLEDAAQRALARVRENSELRELWAEGDGLDTWLRSLDDLARRLTVAGPARPREQSPTRRSRGLQPRPGDVLKLELSPGTFVLLVVLHVSRVWRRAMLVAVPDRLYREGEPFSGSDVPTSTALPVNYVSTTLVADGVCTLLGNHPELLPIFPIPYLQAGGAIYHGDDNLGEIGASAVRPSHNLSGYGDGFIVNRLRRHFGL